MAKSVDFNDLFSGEDKLLSIQVLDEAGAQVDISGCTIEWSLRRHPHSTGTPLIAKTTASGITIRTQTGVDKGYFDVRLLAADLAALVGVYHHVALVTDPTANKTVVIGGWATIKKSGI